MIDLMRLDKTNRNLIFTYQNKNIYGLKIFNINPQSILKDISFERISSYPIYIANYDYLENDYQKIAIHVVETSNEGDIHRILYSNDGGNNWNFVYDQTDNDWGKPTHLKLDTENENKIYISFANENKAGIYATEDLGENFQSIFEDAAVKLFAIHPTNNNLIYAVADEFYSSKLYFTENAGDEWAEMFINWNSAGFVNYMHFTSEENPQLILLETNEIAKITPDDTEIFNYADSNILKEDRLFQPSFMDTNENNWLVQSDFYTIKTENAGENFSRVKVPFAKIQGNIMYNDFDFAHRTIYPVQNGIEVFDEFESSNYRSQFITDFDDPEVNPVQYLCSHYENYFQNFLKKSTENDNYELYWASGYYKFKMLETNYDLYTTRFSPHYGYSLGYHAFYSTTEQKSQMFKVNSSSIDNPTVTPFAIPIDDQKVIGFYIDDELQKILIVYEREIYRSENGGETWELSMGNLPQFGKDDYFKYLTHNHHTPNEYYLTSTTGVYKSTDHGQSWFLINPMDLDRIVISYSHYLFFGYKIPTDTEPFKLVYTVNQGNTWLDCNELDTYHFQTPNTLQLATLFIRENMVRIAVATDDLGVVFKEFSVNEMGTEDEITESSDVTLYPNPTNDQFTIVSKEAIKQVELYDITGRNLMTSNQKTIDISHLTSGIYWVKIINENGKSISKKLIKK